MDGHSIDYNWRNLYWAWELNLETFLYSHFTSMHMPKTIVLSLGGSLIVPDDVDVIFLKSLKSVIEQFAKKGFKFIIVCGG